MLRREMTHVREVASSMAATRRSRAATGRCDGKRSSSSISKSSNNSRSRRSSGSGKSTGGLGDKAVSRPSARRFAATMLPLASLPSAVCQRRSALPVVLGRYKTNQGRLLRSVNNDNGNDNGDHKRRTAVTPNAAGLRVFFCKEQQGCRRQGRQGNGKKSSELVVARLPQ